MTDEDIPAERVQQSLPDGWDALRPRERERIIRVLRSYSREVKHQYGVPVIEADVLADGLESRGGDE